jgi:hypothetical protein
MRNYYVSYQIKSIANLLNVSICHRDIISKLLEESVINDSSYLFIYESSIKKFLNAESSIITVSQGLFRSTYGMYYFGYLDRLVITPLSDSCFFSITKSLNNLNIPVIQGMGGVGKRSVIHSLSYELGCETLSFDSEILTNENTLIDILRASMGCGLWLNITNVENMQENLLSVLLSAFLSFQSCLLLRNETFHISGNTILINLNTKISLISNSIDCNYFSLSTELKSYFRPICFNGPSRNIVLSTLLTAYNYCFVDELVHRMEKLWDYLVHFNLVNDRIIFKLVVQSIREIGQNHDFDSPNCLLQFSNLAKKILFCIPVYLQDLISEIDLRLICNLFLGITYIRDSDLKHFKTILDKSEYEEKIIDFIINSTDIIMFIIGDTNIGKSTVINSAINSSIKSVSDKVDKEKEYFLKNKMNNNELRSSVKIEKYPFIFNPSIMVNCELLDHTSFATEKNSVLYETRRVINTLLLNFDLKDKIQIVHVDCSNSERMIPVIASITEFICNTQLKVKFIFESLEISSLAPSVVTKFPIVCMCDSVFDLQSKVDFHLKAISTRLYYKFFYWSLIRFNYSYFPIELASMRNPI